jgi:hypothetical protein
MLKPVAVRGGSSAVPLQNRAALVRLSQLVFQLGLLPAPRRRSLLRTVRIAEHLGCYQPRRGLRAPPRQRVEPEDCALQADARPVSSRRSRRRVVHGRLI